jgi:hypothetical protein
MFIDPKFEKEANSVQFLMGKGFKKIAVSKTQDNKIVLLIPKDNKWIPATWGDAYPNFTKNKPEYKTKPLAWEYSKEPTMGYHVVDFEIDSSRIIKDWHFGSPVSKIGPLSDEDAKLFKLKESLPRVKMNEGVKDLRPKIEAIIKKHNISSEELKAQLKKGTKVEKEHTSNPTVAMKIALDHLEENPNYYDVLAKVGLEEEEGKAAPYGSGYKPLEEELKPLILDFTSFLVTNGMKLHPFPKIEFISNDEENAKDPLGKTAYYNPETKCITLFTLNRHPKDILRSYSHELVHHMQNIEDRLKPMTTANVYEDEELADIEKEAHELGSMNLRKWEDSKKTNLKEETASDYKIYSDMDGVITDFDTQFKKIAGMLPEEYETKNGKEAFWDLIGSKGVGFWVGMPWMPDGDEYWSYIEKYNPTILSAPSRDESSRLGKRLWIKKYLPGTKLILSPAKYKQKYAAPNHILIDDKPSNIEDRKSVV